MEAGARHWLRIARRLFLVIGACLLMAAPASAESSRLSSPSTLNQDYEARVAVAGDDLWMSVLGTNRKGHFRIEVLRRSSGKWSRLPRLRTLYEKDHQFAALTPVAGPTIPCVGDSPRDKARIRCFSKGTWRKMDLDPSLTDMVVTGLKTDGPALTASFTRWNQDGSSTIAVGRSVGESIAPDGSPLNVGWRTLTQLGSQTADAQPRPADLSLHTWSGPAPASLMATSLDAGAWNAFDPLPVGKTGKQVSGPVRTSEGLYFPITRELPGNGPISNWSTSLYRKTADSWEQVTGKGVGNGSGANAGGAFPVGDRVWFVWLRVWMGNRGVKSRLVAARVGPDGGTYDRRIVLLRKNADQNYQVPQAISYQNRIVFLYQRTVKSAWRATLDFSR